MLRKGKILKVRCGYNANSSSLTALVSTLLLGAAGATALLSMVAAALFSRPRAPGGHGTANEPRV